MNNTLSTPARLLVDLQKAFFLLLALLLFAIPSAAAKDKKPKSTTDGESRYAKLKLEETDRVAGRDAPLKKSALVHYKNWGKGSEALVLIHGWTCSMEYWRDQIPDLAKRNRLIALDLPGHGQSDKPEINYSMDLFARAVQAVMRDAHVKRAVLVGHSMGTPIARQFYRKYPQQTLAIVIVDGSVRPFGDKKMLEGLLGGLRGPSYQQVAAQMFTFLGGPHLSAVDMGRIRASFLNTPQYVVVSAMEGMADPAIWGDDRINVPVLAVLAKTPFFPPNIEEIFRAVAPTLELHMWEGVGHFLMIEKPKQFNETVITFLDKNALLRK